MDDKIPHKTDQRTVMISSQSLKNFPVCRGTHCRTIAGREYDYPGGTPGPIWRSNADFYPLHNLETTFSCRPALALNAPTTQSFLETRGQLTCELMIIWGHKSTTALSKKKTNTHKWKCKTSELVMSKDEVSSYWNQHTASVNRRFVCSSLLVNAQDFLYKGLPEDLSNWWGWGGSEQGWGHDYKVYFSPIML